jgi:hypothetical protein
MENCYRKNNNKNCSIKCGAVFLVLILFVVASGSYGYATSDVYDSGYDHGCDDAGISDHSNRYYNQPEKGPSFHTEAFNSGYEDGLNACSGGGPDESPGERDDGDGDGNDGSSPGNAQSGRGGMDWNKVCNTLQPVLLQSCSGLVNSDGTFTLDGERAYGCIRNGVLLAGGGMAFQLPLPVITAALRVLETPTGCGGIVDWSSINQVSNLGGILRFFR